MKSLLAVLTEDSAEYTEGDAVWVSLHYSTRSNEQAGAGLPKDKCPPVKELKKGARVRVFYRGNWAGAGGELSRMELVK